MLSLLLLNKIAALLLMVLVGVILVKSKLLTASDSKIISVVSLYVASPSMLIYTILVDRKPGLMQGLFWAVILSFVVYIISIILVVLIRRPLKLDAVEQGSLEYTNIGAFALPLVIAVLGPENAIYCTVTMIIENLFMWTHLFKLTSVKSRIPVKTILTNPNVIAILVATIIFAFNIKVPQIVDTALSSFSNLVAPLCMLVTGILLGSADFKAIFSKKRIWMVIFLKLIAMPLVFILLLKTTGFSSIIPDGENIVIALIIMTASPSATNVFNFAQIHDQDSHYASAINTLTTLLCVATMPLLIALL